MLRDRLSFALFGQLVTRDQRVLNQVRFIPDELSPVVPETRDLKLLGKLNWEVGPADAVTLSLARLHSDVERFGSTGFESAEATQRGASRYLYYNLAWQRSTSPASYLEVRVGGLRGSDRLDPYAGPDVPGLRTIEPYSARIYHNAVFRERRRPPPPPRARGPFACPGVPEPVTPDPARAGPAARGPHPAPHGLISRAGGLIDAPRTEPVRSGVRRQSLSLITWWRFALPDSAR